MFISLANLLSKFHLLGAKKVFQEYLGLDTLHVLKKLRGICWFF